MIEPHKWDLYQKLLSHLNLPNKRVYLSAASAFLWIIQTHTVTWVSLNCNNREEQIQLHQIF